MTEPAPTYVFPDAEATLTAALTGRFLDPNGQPIPAGTHTPPALEGRWYIQVEQIPGGLIRDHVTAVTPVEISIYAPDLDTSGLIAQALEAYLIYSLPATEPSPAALVDRVTLTRRIAPTYWPNPLVTRRLGAINIEMRAQLAGE